jgi:Flp pilus assembly protein TadD
MPSEKCALRLLVGAALALMLAGCGPDEVGQYSEAKQEWDSPRDMAQMQEMRHRAFYTQRDH